jgi:hypothetical protein
MEQRRFHRVKFTALGDLFHQGLNYRVRLENLSLRGALVSSHECIMIPAGDRCTLTIRLDSEDTLFVLTVEIMHSFFSMVGVQFVDFEKDAELRLFQLLSGITKEPEKLGQEWQQILSERIPQPQATP